MAKWCVFLQASRSGFYSFKARYESRKAEKVSMKAIVKGIFDESGGTYGPERVCGELRKRGHKCSYGKISDYMAEMGLSSIHNRFKKSRSLTDSRKARGDGFPNLVRGEVFDAPGQAVCSDITYLKCGEGWEYHCIVKDIVSGEILGESTGERK